VRNYFVARATISTYTRTVTSTPLTLIGRSSSTFTRVARIFATELGLAHELEVVRDLASLDAREYGGNPALQVPSLRTAQATWFGSLNVCRELVRLAGGRSRVVWPEALEQPLLANMQELVLQAMSTEVGLIMSRIAAQPIDTFHRAKMTQRLANTLSWLDAHVGPALAALPPERELSYLEVTLFCLVAHLDFRNVMSTAPYSELTAFGQRFGARPACAATEYQFDVS
jgi:glutathione S-transferase